MPTAEILVLASSKKLGGRCVAGLDKKGEWVRPVSAGPHGLYPAECEVEGRLPEVLDVVRFEYAERLEDPAQPENVLIEDSPWELRRRMPPEEAYGRLRNYLWEGRRLLGNRGKAVPEEEAAKGVDASLALIEPTGGVSFLIRPPEEEEGKYKARVVFDFAAKRYDLRLTDIPLERAVRDAGVGEHSPEDLGLDASGKTLVTVSLGEPNNGWHTKLAAAVLFLPSD